MSNFVKTFIFLALAGYACFSILVNNQPKPKILHGSSFMLFQHRFVQLDYNLIFGNVFDKVGPYLTRADVWFVASSKGLHGFRVEEIQKSMSRSLGREIKGYNFSFLNSESLGLIGEAAKKYDLRGKTIVMDLAQTSSKYQFSLRARKVLEFGGMQSSVEVLATYSQYFFDRAFHYIIPRFSIPSEGPDFATRGTSADFRSWATGDLYDEALKKLKAEYPIKPAPAPLTDEFDADGMIRSRVIEPIRAKGARIIAVAIPLSWYPHPGNPTFDPVWSQRAAEKLGIEFLPVDWEGLFTLDGNHMDPRSALLYSTRLAHELSKVH